MCERMYSAMWDTVFRNMVRTSQSVVSYRIRKAGFPGFIGWIKVPCKELLLVGRCSVLPSNKVRG